MNYMSPRNVEAQLKIKGIIQREISNFLKLKCKASCGN
jgi:hypothetical protein